MEIEIAAKHFIGSFAAKHHLDAHTLDDTGQQIHRSGCTDRRNIIGLNVVDHIAQGIQSLLKGVMYLVMHGTDIVGHFTRFRQIGSSFQSDGEGMQLGPPGFLGSVRFNAVGSKLLGHGRNHGAVQPAGKKNSVRNVTHQLTADGFFQCIPQLTHGSSVVLHGIIVHPVTYVPAFHFSLASGIIMSRKERFIALTISFERLQFAGAIHRSVLVVTDIQGNHANGIAGNQEIILFFVIKGKGENSVQFLQERNTFVAIQGQDHLTITSRLEMIASFIPLADVTVIIDLAVDRQNLPAVHRIKRLASALGINDRKTFVSQNRRTSTINSTPVRTTMTNLARHRQSFVSPLGSLFPDIEYTHNSTHIDFYFKGLL